MSFALKLKFFFFVFLEVEVEGRDLAGTWWIIFVYLSPEEGKGRAQWEKLKTRRRLWG